MKGQKQKVVSGTYGDCFPACMATLLELPIEVLPNDHSEEWHNIWRIFLEQFGLEMGYGGSAGPIWKNHPWIATVKSKNFENGTHAIVMDGHEVAFDPSTKKTYTKGQSLLGKNVVLGGWIITVSDFTKIHKLQKYREKLALEIKPS